MQKTKKYKRTLNFGETFLEDQRWTVKILFTFFAFSQFSPLASTHWQAPELPVEGSAVCVCSEHFCDCLWPRGSGEVEKWRSWERGEDSSPLIKGLSTAKSSKCQISANYCKHRISFSLHSHYFYLLPDFQPWAGKWCRCRNVTVNYWHQNHGLNLLFHQKFYKWH